MNKIVCLGAVSVYNDKAAPLFCRVKFGPDELNPNKAGPVLSIKGVVGPTKDGNAAGSSGQCLEAVLHVAAFDPGWDKAMALRFHEVWRAWHLNGTRPGCVHQTELGWKICHGHRSKDPADVALVLQLENRLGLIEDCEKDIATLQRLGTGESKAQELRESLAQMKLLVPDAARHKLPQQSHPWSSGDVEFHCGTLEGLPMPCGQPDALNQPCPTCGYKYGSAWLFEPVPAEVVEFLESLPATERVPAWI